MEPFDINKLNQWLGREQVVAGELTAVTANLMQATLNRQPTLQTGDELPPAWHWLYFHEPVPLGSVGADGHPQLGGFMPPVSFGTEAPPRRMWAGGKLTFVHPLRLGEWVTKRSVIKAITPKEGKNGRLCFVIVEHELLVDNQRRLLEEQTIVYREPATTGGNAVAAPPAPTDGDFSTTWHPTPVMLFRYSALTFNSHRIHYDVDFCRQHEGYPDLVVHGPLTAALLLDLFYRQYPGKRITSFSYRGLSPLFNPHPFTVHGTAGGQAWASNASGGLAMSATVEMQTR
ncbi:MAG: MaoC family dehydratase N-terminal domain-containing protein [Chloroflexota bacterium]